MASVKTPKTRTTPAPAPKATPKPKPSHGIADLSVKDLAVKILSDRAANYMEVTREGTDFATSIMIGDVGSMEPLNPVSPEGLMMWAKAKELLGPEQGVLISLNGDRYHQVEPGRFALQGPGIRPGTLPSVRIYPEPVVNLAVPAKASGRSAVKNYDLEEKTYGPGGVSDEELKDLRDRAARYDALMRGRPAMCHTYEETVKDGRLLGREKFGDAWLPVPPQRAAELKGHIGTVKERSKDAFDTLSEANLLLAAGDTEGVAKLLEKAQLQLYQGFTY